MSTDSFRAFVDRFEGDKAVLLLGEDEKDAISIPRKYLPQGVREGAVLTITMRYEPEKTIEVANEAKEIIKRLTER